MNFHISFVLLLAACVISSQDDDGDIKDARKHYGLSYHTKCIDYVKSFTCMTSCKSIGFQVFRMDFRCKCSCHDLKTTTILPFFKWRTNGTTKTLPSTQSPQLYHIAGTMSPARSSNGHTEKIENTTTTSSCGLVTDNATTVDTVTDPDDGTTVAEGAADNVTEPDDGTTVAEGAADNVTDPDGATTVADGAANNVTDPDGATTVADGADGTQTGNETTTADGTSTSSDDQTTDGDGNSTSSFNSTTVNGSTDDE